MGRPVNEVLCEQITGTPVEDSKWMEKTIADDAPE